MPKAETQTENVEQVVETVVDQTVDNTDAAPKKRKRRGISDDTRSTTRKRFHESEICPSFPKLAVFEGHLHDVNLSWATIKGDSDSVFAGKAVPYLNFDFRSNHAAEVDQRFATNTLSVIPSNVDTCPGGSQEWRINNTFGIIKHYLDVYVLQGRPMPEKIRDMLELELDDTDDDGMYVPVEIDEVIAAWAKLFTNVVKIFNEMGTNTSKKIYYDKNNKWIPLWLHLVRYTRQIEKGGKAKAWKPADGKVGELTFPPFLGKGYIEIKREGFPPTIRLEGNTESIDIKEVESVSATPVGPTLGGGAIQVPGDIGGGLPSGGYVGPQPGDDLPF